MLEDILTRTFQKCSKEELIEIVVGFILNQHPQKKQQYATYRAPISIGKGKDLMLEFMFETRAGAEVVLDAISNIVNAGMAVTLSDVHVMCGYSPDEDYKKIGFTNMDGFYIVHRRDGWLLCLPRPTKLGGT